MKILYFLAIPLCLFSDLVSPSNLTLSATSSSVTLQWTDNADSETGYKIYRGDQLIDMLDANVTVYEDIFLLPLTSYSYMVRATDAISLDAKQHQIMDEFVSVFENSTLDLGYARTYELNDTRGITAGRAGFTSATGDMLMVIERYSETVPNNSLKKYIDELKRLEILRYVEDEKEASASVENLTFLREAWEECSADAVFRQVQDKVAYEEYYYPALQKAHDIGAHYQLTVLSLYDTAIQHGYNGMLDIMNEVESASPMAGGDEVAWLREFNDKRRVILESDSTWAESVARVDALKDLIDAKNYTLDPFTFVEDDGTVYKLGE